MSTTGAQLDDLVKGVLARAFIARRWLALMEQGTHWLPKESFGAWVLAERGAPADAVPGAIAVASMDESYRRNVEAFLWRKAKGVTDALAVNELEMEMSDASETSMDAGAGEDARWMRLYEHEAQRRAWFESLPLVRALRT